MNQKLNRALKILATCKPEALAEHTCFTGEVCREAIETARLITLAWKTIRPGPVHREPLPREIG